MSRRGNMAKNQKMNDLFAYIGGGGARIYGELLEKQARGEEISKPQQEFMDRAERMMEYVAPKLARVEQAILQKSDIKIEMVNYTDKKSE